MLMIFVILPLVSLLVAFLIAFLMGFLFGTFPVLASEPLRSIIVGAVVVTASLIISVLMIYTERKVAARLHGRLGPYLVGRPHGWLQLIADALKMLLKEDIVPRKADKFLFNLAPILFVFSAILAFAVVPADNGAVLFDWDLGILFILAVAGFPIIGNILAGFASNSKYPLISAVRSAGVMLAYEVPLVLTILVPVVLAGSFNLTDIVEAQKSLPYIFVPIVGQVAFIIFLITSLAETNRAPFDIAEAESELVSGANVEYSGMKFGFFYLGEYIFHFISAILIVIFFLAGWHGLFLPGWAWMVIKVYFVYVFLLLIRWTYTRYRLDQFIALAWKWLIPLSFANFILAVLVKYYFM